MDAALVFYEAFFYTGRGLKGYLNRRPGHPGEAAMLLRGRGERRAAVHAVGEGERRSSKPGNSGGEASHGKVAVQATRNPRSVPYCRSPFFLPLLPSLV